FLLVPLCAPELVQQALELVELHGLFLLIGLPYPNNSSYSCLSSWLRLPLSYSFLNSRLFLTSSSNSSSGMTRGPSCAPSAGGLPVIGPPPPQHIQNCFRADNSPNAKDRASHMSSCGPIGNDSSSSRNASVASLRTTLMWPLSAIAAVGVALSILEPVL